MSHSSLLPVGFEELEPFVAFWAVGTTAARANCRDTSDEASREAFYHTASVLAPKALEYLDQKSLDELNEGEQRLMQIVLSFAHVAMAVELQREEEDEHAKWRPFMRITRSTGDM